MSKVARSVGVVALSVAVLAGCGSSKKSSTATTTEAPASRQDERGEC